MNDKELKKAARNADAVAQQHRKIQTQQDRKDARTSGKRKCAQDAMAAPGPGHGVPVPPLKAQALDKPGHEQDLATPPQYLAKSYRGSGKLEGKAAIITGGDSGIGRAVAVLFAREGADVAILYLSEDADARTTCEVVESEGRRCVAIAGDVQDPDFCRKAVRKVVKALGSVDILVNNAAFQEHAQSIEDLTDERLDLTFRTNIFGYFHMVQAVLPHLKRGDAIINTGYVTGIRGSKHLLDYSATKGAIHAFTKALAKNLMDQGSRVNAVAPGPVWTPLNPADKQAKDIARFGKDTDMGRPAQPEEMAPAYVFLASQVCSSYISGIVLPLTGDVE